MFTNKYDLRPRASSASATERSPWPAAHSESTPVEQAGSASPHVGGSFIQIEMGDALSPQAGSQRDEVFNADVDISQDGQTLPSSLRPRRFWQLCPPRILVPPPRKIAWGTNYIHPMVTPHPPQLSHLSLIEIFQMTPL